MSFDEFYSVFHINFKPGNHTPLGMWRKGSFFYKKIKKSLIFLLSSEKFSILNTVKQRLIRSVSAKYRAIDTTLKKQYYTYTDVDGNTARYRKDLNWLQHPVVYRRPQADLVRGRDWSFVNDKNGGLLLSIATLTGRTKVRFVVKGSEDILNDQTCRA